MDEETRKKEFVRDICAVGWRPKSEVRRKLNEILKIHNQSLLEKIEDFKKEIYERVGENKKLDNALPIIKLIFQKIKILIK